MDVGLMVEKEDYSSKGSSTEIRKKKQGGSLEELQTLTEIQTSMDQCATLQTA